MTNSKLFLFLLFPLLSFLTADQGTRLIFEEEKGMRSSFCMYSDGRFFEARPAGCIEQVFYSGTWTKTGDTVTFKYSSDNAFTFEVVKSAGTSSKYQIVRIVDCYNKPVRFQTVCADTTCSNLYNPGILKVPKGKLVSYYTPFLAC